MGISPLTTESRCLWFQSACTKQCSRHLALHPNKRLFAKTFTHSTLSRKWENYKKFQKISTLLSAFWRQRSSYWPNKLCLASAVGDFDSLAFLLRLKSSSFSLLFYVNAYWRTANPCNRDLRTGTGLNMSSKTHRGWTLVVRFCPTDFGGRILPQNKSFPSQTWFFRQKFSDKVVLCVIIYHYIVL